MSIVPEHAEGTWRAGRKGKALLLYEGERWEWKCSTRRSEERIIKNES
jgi:hypothetical protein